MHAIDSKLPQAPQEDGEAAHETLVRILTWADVLSDAVAITMLALLFGWWLW